jgi:hypothetical protein
MCGPADEQEADVAADRPARGAEQHHSHPLPAHDRALEGEVDDRDRRARGRGERQATGDDG